MRARPGFTLAEVLIAVILIDAGLLALVAGTAVLVRQTNELRLRTAALRAANNRLQQLGSSPCQATAGAAAAAGVREDWVVAPRSDSVGDVRDSVTFQIGSASRSVVLSTRLPC